MTPTQLREACKVTNLDWFMNWPWEQITGQVQFPEPVELDSNITMSDEVRYLRDTYLAMQALCPNIKQAEFRWEQIDFWDIAIQYWEHPQFPIDGSKARYNPGVSGLATTFRRPSKHVLWILPFLIWIDLLIVHYVFRAIRPDQAGEPGAESRMIRVITIGILFFAHFVRCIRGVHQGELIKV